MMCLGWTAKPACGQEQEQGACPDITWFLILAAGLGLVVATNPKRERTAGATATAA